MWGLNAANRAVPGLSPAWVEFKILLLFMQLLVAAIL